MEARTSFKATEGISKLEIRAAQRQDPPCISIRTFLNTGRLPDYDKDRIKAKLVATLGPLCYEAEGMIWTTDKRGSNAPATCRALAPESKRQRIIASAHGPPLVGHWGIERTMIRILNDYFWPSMARDVHEYIEKCAECRTNAKESIATLRPLQAAKDFNQRVHIDLVGPFLRPSGQDNKYVLVIIDAF